MEIYVRKAGIKDFQMIVELNKKLFDFEVQFKHEYNTDWPFGEGKKYFKKRLRTPKAIAFVAEKEKMIIGYIICYIDTYSYRSAKVNPICEIENMFVEEKFRNNGVGKNLIDAVKDEAKKRKVKLLRVGAIAQNTNAIDFYRAQNFSDSNLYLEYKL